MTSKNLSAPDNMARDPIAAASPDSSPSPAGPQDPTILLPDPEESTFFDAPTAGTIYLPEQDAPAPRTLLTQSQFSRERQQEEAEALSSLDDTVLRPPLDIPASEPATPGVPSPQPSAPAQTTPSVKAPRHIGHYLAVAAALLVACLVGLRAQASRASSVGLFGLPQQAEDDAPASTSAQVTQPIVPLASIKEDEPQAEPEPQAAPDVEEEDSPTDRYPWLTYTSPYGSTETGYEDDPHPDSWTTHEDSDDSSTGSDSITYTWDYGSRDDRSVSLTFDGGNVTYYYDDELLTFDLDELDRLLGDGEVWATPDSWGYGSAPHGRGGSSYYSYGGPRGR